MYPAMNTIHNIVLMYCAITHHGVVEAHTKKVQDLFFDKLVSIVIKVRDTTIKHVTTGIIIDKQRILTSFRPFTRIPQHKMYETVYERLLVCYVVHRYPSYPNTIFLEEKCIPTTCFKSVIPSHNEDNNMLQMKNNVVLDDLLVIRLEKPLNLVPVKNRYSTYYDPQAQMAGPLQSYLADINDNIGDTGWYGAIKLKGLKYLTHLKGIYIRNKNRTMKYEEDCENWLPKGWGHFICIKYTRSISNVGNYGVLYSNNKLFGVGNLILRFKNGTMSVLVLTDVRPYQELIMKTCDDD